MSTKQLYLLLYFGLLSAGLPLAAQTTGAEKTKIIKWPKSNKATLPQNLPAVSGIETMSFLWDTTQLGFAQVGMSNRKIRAVPEAPVSEFLNKNLNDRYAALFQPNGYRLLWIIHDLRVSEHSGAASEQSFVRLKATAYYGNNKDSNYRKLLHFDTVMRRGGMDVTGQHGANIAAAFDALLQNSFGAGVHFSAEATPLSREQIIEQEGSKKSKAILRANGHYKNGVYTSFNDFLANNPAITRFSILRQGRKTSLNEVTPSGSKVVAGAWGACKDGRLYVRYKDRLLEVEQVGNGFVLGEYAEMAKLRQKEMMRAAVIGGMMGAALASTADEMPKVTAFPYLGKKLPEASVIDMETGELVF